MAEFYVIANDYAFWIVFQLLLSFFCSTYLKYVVINAEISVLGSDNVVVDTHLVVEESLAHASDICILTLQRIHEVGIVDEYLLYLS